MGSNPSDGTVWQRWHLDDFTRFQFVERPVPASREHPLQGWQRKRKTMHDTQKKRWRQLSLTRGRGWKQITVLCISVALYFLYPTLMQQVPPGGLRGGRRGQAVAGEGGGVWGTASVLWRGDTGGRGS